MARNYEMYRVFKGEKANPYDGKKEGIKHKFWFYESVFDTRFYENDTSKWFAFFKQHAKEAAFMDILSEADHDKLTENAKKPVFELWLEYLFEDKLYPEYGGENTDKKYYYSIAR